MICSRRKAGEIECLSGLYLAGCGKPLTGPSTLCQRRASDWPDTLRLARRLCKASAVPTSDKMRQNRPERLELKTDLHRGCLHYSLYSFLLSTAIELK